MNLLRQWSWLCEQDGVLHRRVFRSDGGGEVLQVVLPSLLHHEVLTQLHQEHGHQGVERTTELVQQRCYWPGLTSDVVQWRPGTVNTLDTKYTQLRPSSFMGHLLASRPN